MVYADYTANYIKSITSTDQAYMKKPPMIDIIYECDIGDYRLIKPIAVNIEQDYNDYAVSHSITGIYSFGDTEPEAKMNFCQAMEGVYIFLLEDDKNLSSVNKKTLNYLEKILSRKQV